MQPNDSRGRIPRGLHPTRAEAAVIRASEFVPVLFEVSVPGSELTKSGSRLAARLLAKYGDLVSPEMGVRWSGGRRSIEDFFQLGFSDYGYLDIRRYGLQFLGSFTDESGPEQDRVPERLRWTLELVTTVMELQKQPVMALTLGISWHLRGETTTDRLVDHFGLRNALGGLFASARSFEIRGDTTVELPGLFVVDCELAAGRVVGDEHPEDVGVEITYRAPDNRLDERARVNYSRDTIDQFFSAAPAAMRRQLKHYFPGGEHP